MSLVRFDIRPDEQGWTIFDRETEKPASVEGHETVGLPREEADEIADLLNTLAFIEQRRTVHRRSGGEAVVRRSGPRFVTCLLASLLITHTPAAALTEVDVALVLAVDISNSMDPEEQALQREGFIAAFRSPLVHDAIRKGAHGRVAVTYMEWAGSVTQQVVVPWTIIEDSGAASELAGQLAAAPIRRAPRTSISAAIDYSVLLLEGSGVEAARRVIDISGDGANNEGRPVTNARNEALDRGIVINGLPIMLKRGGYWDIEHLDLYSRVCVIGGLGAFMVPIRERQAVRGGGHRCGLRTARGALRWAATHDCACQNRRVVRRPVHVSNHVNAERRWRTRQSGSDCGSCRCSGDPAQRFLAT